jgi:predicted patatin/cPLA2 family phospholipase
MAASSPEPQRADAPEFSAQRVPLVQDLMRQRLAEGSMPGRRSDPYRLALAIEGGSMRSVVAAGMTLALQELGYRDVFDDVYGSSAGSIVGAYFVTGQASLAPAIYYENMCSKKFVNLARIVARQPIMSLDYLFEVLEHEKPLDWEGVVKSPIRLHPLATSVADRAAVDFGGFTNPDELRACLRAASTLPVIAGPPFEIDGATYLDGGLFESFPFRPALRDGCTHVLVLRTRPAGNLPSGVSWKQRLLVERVLGADRALVDLADSRPQRYEAEAQELASLIASNGDSGVAVAAIGPADHGTLADRLSIDAALVKQNAIDGMAAVYEAFDMPVPAIFAVLRPCPVPS